LSRGISPVILIKRFVMLSIDKQFEPEKNSFGCGLAGSRALAHAWRENNLSLSRGFEGQYETFTQALVDLHR
jgi:hypothetical protein